MMLKDSQRYRKIIIPLVNLSNILEYFISKKKKTINDAHKMANAIRVMRKPLVKLTFGRIIPLPSGIIRRNRGVTLSPIRRGALLRHR